jgi:hypothetical protein
MQSHGRRHAVRGGGDNSLTERIEQAVDMYAFVFHELGVAYKGARGR